MTTPMPIIEAKNILLGDHALLDQLLASSINIKQGESNSATTRGSLIALLQTLQSKISESQTCPGNLLKALTPDLPDGQQIDLPDCRRLRMIDAIFDKLAKITNVDPVIMNQLQRLRIPYGKLALIDDSLLASANHRAHGLIDDICVYSIGWYPGLEKSGEKFIQQIEKTISKFMVDFVSEPMELGGLQQLSDFLKKDAERMKKIAARQCDTEIGKVKARHAKSQATAYINQISQACPLPPSAIEFLQDSWFKTLRLIQVQKGSESDEWVHAKQLSQELLLSLRAFTNDKERAKQMELIPELRERLVIAMQQADTSGEIAAAAEKQLNAIEEQQVIVLKGERPEAVTVDLMPQLDVVETVDSIESIPLLGKVLELTPGQWMLYRNDEGVWERCQLARKIDGINKLLFVNRQGITVMAKSLGELAHCLATGQAKPIESRKTFSIAYRSVLKQLLTRYEEMRNS